MRRLLILILCGLATLAGCAERHLRADEPPACQPIKLRTYWTERPVGNIIWADTHFLLHAGDDDLLGPRRLTAYTEQGAVLWTRLYERAFDVVWHHQGETRAIRSDRAGLTIYRIEAGEATRLATYAVPLRPGRRVDFVLPASDALWVMLPAGRALRIENGQITLDHQPFTAPLPKGAYQSHWRRSVVLTPENHLVQLLRQYTYFEGRKQRTGLAGILTPAGEWHLHDLGEQPVAGLVTAPDGFRALAMQTTPVAFGDQLHHRAVGVQWTELDPTLTARRSQSIAIPVACDSESATYGNELIQVGDDWIAHGGTCARGDARDIWFARLNAKGEALQFGRIDRDVEDTVRSVAFSPNGVMAVLADHRRCCHDTPGRETSYLLFVDPKWRCLAGLKRSKE